VDVLINGDKVDALAMICHVDNARHRGLAITEKMKELIPRQMFDVAIQAAIGNQIIARPPSRPCARTCWPSVMAATCRARRSCWNKQKEGKKRMKQVGQRGNSARSLPGRAQGRQVTRPEP
jgi:GTP-binding protein LepA